LRLTLTKAAETMCDRCSLLFVKRATVENEKNVSRVKTKSEFAQVKQGEDQNRQKKSTKSGTPVTCYTKQVTPPRTGNRGGRASFRRAELGDVVQNRQFATTDAGPLMAGTLRILFSSP
jgi:hypothetical protein